MKKVLHARKLWQKGYRPQTEEAIERFKEIISKQPVDQLSLPDGGPLVHVCTGDLTAPSHPANQDMIFATKHKYVLLTHKMFINDPFIKELQEWLENNKKVEENKENGKSNKVEENGKVEENNK